MPLKKTDESGFVEYFRSDKNYQYYWRVKALNGKIVTGSEGYKQRESAMNGFNSLVKIVTGNYSVKILTPTDLRKKKKKVVRKKA